MQPHTRSLAALFIALSFSALRLAASSFEWREARPESEGMSSERLEALTEALVERNSKGFLVIRNDRIVWEWYAPGNGRNEKHYTASLENPHLGG